LFLSEEIGMSIWTERSYSIGDAANEPGEFITVSPAPDFPDHGVLLATIGDKAENAFGKIYVQLSTEYMRAIGEALIKCCDDVEAEAKEK
jgi:hypothetical protein